MKIRCKEEAEKWPLLGLALPDHSQTDFSQLIDCPEFVPRNVVEKQTGERKPYRLKTDIMWSHDDVKRTCFGPTCIIWHSI